MTDEKKDIEYYKARPDEYSITSIGSVRDNKTGRIVHMDPSLNPYALTPEKLREFAKQTKARRIRSVVKGRLKAARKFLAGSELTRKIDIPDPDTLTDDELIEAAGDADELTSYLFHLAFYKNAEKAGSGDGGNFRAITEAYGKTMENFTEEQRHEAPAERGKISAAPDTLLELVRAMEQEIEARRHQAQAIEGKTI